MIPHPAPTPNGRVVTDSSDTIIVFAQGPEDVTERPRSFEIPPGWPWPGRETEDVGFRFANESENPPTK